MTRFETSNKSPLIYLDKPIPSTIKASANIQYGYLYGVVNLTCEAEAEPAADFTWYRHKKLLNPKVHLIHSEGHESIMQVWSFQYYLIYGK